MGDEVVRAANIALLALGSIQSLIMLLSFHRDRLKNKSEGTFFAQIAVSAACMVCFCIYYIRGPELRDPLNLILLCLSLAGIYAVYYLYLEYLSAQIAELDSGRSLSRTLSNISLISCVVGAMLWVISTVGDDFDEINAITPIELGHIGGLLMIIITLGVLAENYRTLGLRQSVILSTMPVLMLLATIGEHHSHGIELHYPAIIIEVLIIYTQHHLDMENRIERDEMADARAKLALATGRMKPHYIYNVLTTIYYLCETDPEKAQRAVGTFSEYLRNTLEVMERQELVSFAAELSEIRHYLELEKLRFGKRLKVEYDVEYDEFSVPPLSIQPLVENAVKHGIAAKEEGGTVRIVSRKLADGGAQIRIRDDGVGFDIDSLNLLDVTHEGLANVRERLRLEVGGDMTITSAPGKGTTVVVTIRPPAAS